MRRLAVIGLGNIATRHRRNLKQLYPCATVLAMSASGKSVTELPSDANAVVCSVDELVDAQVELVIVASPATLHFEHASVLIEAGIPTLIEKPLAANLQDAEKFLTLSESTPTAVGYCLRYLPSAIKMYELMSTHFLGEIYSTYIEVGQHLSSWRPGKDYKQSVSANAALGGGALLELSHELDYAVWLLGQLDVNHAVLRSSTQLGLNVEDQANLVLRSPSDGVCHIHLDFLQHHPQRFCNLIGEKGRLHWDLIKNRVVYFSGDGEQVLFDDPQWDKNQMYLAMILDFENKIAGRENHCVSVSEALNVMRLIEQVKERAEQ